MRRFVFKLENVLRYRKTLEDMAKSSYQGALRFLTIEKDHLLNLQKKQQELMEGTGTVVHPDALSFLNRYYLQLGSRIDHQEQVIREKEMIAREKFQEWKQKQTDVEKIERLKEKQWREYRGEADKEEQKFREKKQGLMR